MDQIHASGQQSPRIHKEVGRTARFAGSKASNTASHIELKHHPHLSPPFPPVQDTQIDVLVTCGHHCSLIQADRRCEEEMGRRGGGGVCMVIGSIHKLMDLICCTVCGV